MRPNAHNTSASLLALAMLSSGCPSTVDGTVSDGGADVPVALRDAPSGPCRWRAGEAVVLPAIGSAMAHRTLLDARSAEGGAWVLTADDAGGDREPDVALERVDASGHRRAGGAVRLPPGDAPSSASLAVDDALGRRAVLYEVRDLRGASCAITLLDALGNPSARRPISFPMGGFALAGCRDLLANGAGYTFLAEQVRALWGASVVQLDAAGETPAQMAPAVLDGWPEVSFERFGLADRSFVLASREAPGPQPRMSRVHLRRFDEAGNALADSQTPVATVREVRDLVVVGAGGSLLALWEEGTAAPPAYGVVARALDAEGRPRGEAIAVLPSRFYEGGLAAAEAQGDVLVGGIAGSGVGLPGVIPLAPDGTPRGDVVAIPMPPGATGVERLRIVATPSGALVVFTTDPGRHPNRLVAVPIACER